MSVKPFVYQDPFPLAKDETKYRKIEGSEKYILVETFADTDVVRVCPEALSILANEAMKDVSFLLRPAHNEQVAKILNDPLQNLRLLSPRQSRKQVLEIAENRHNFQLLL